MQFETTAEQGSQHLVRFNYTSSSECPEGFSEYNNSAVLGLKPMLGCSYDKPVCTPTFFSLELENRRLFRFDSALLVRSQLKGVCALAPHHHFLLLRTGNHPHAMAPSDCVLGTFNLSYTLSI